MSWTIRETSHRWGLICQLLVTLFGSSAFSSETNFLSRTRLLTIEGRRAGEGYFSADGRHLVFQSEREADNPFYQIYTLDLESGESRRVSPGTGKTTCAFFRPGTEEILFASTHLDPATPDHQRAEFELRASGKQRRYAWDYDEQMDLFVVQRDGSSVRRLTDTPGYDAKGSTADIHTMALDGTDQRRLTDFASMSWAPYFHPSGEYVVFTSNKHGFGNFELFIVDATGLKEPVRVTSTDGFDGLPVFSPDARQLSWTSARTADARSQLFMAQ